MTSPKRKGSLEKIELSNHKIVSKVNELNQSISAGPKHHISNTSEFYSEPSVKDNFSQNEVPTTIKGTNPDLLVKKLTSTSFKSVSSLY